jgi:hypothetical protein
MYQTVGKYYENWLRSLLPLLNLDKESQKRHAKSATYVLAMQAAWRPRHKHTIAAGLMLSQEKCVRIWRLIKSDLWI